MRSEAKPGARLLTELVIKLSGLRRGEAVACDSLGSVGLQAALGEVTSKRTRANLLPDYTPLR